MAASALIACRSELSQLEAAGVSDSTTRVPGKPADVGVARLRCDAPKPGPRMLRRLTREQLENTLRDVFPAAQAQWAGFALPDLASPLGFSNDAAVLVVSPQTEREYLASVELLADAAAASDVLSQALPCATSSGDASCGEQLVARYGPRLFRRPLDAQELARYGELFRSIAAASDFERAAKWTLVALMQSPHLLYRSELGRERSDGYRLTPYELATELAYTFGDTGPSPELIARAERGELDDAETRVAEARRLLDSERGRAGVQRLFRQWLRYDAVTSADRAAIPGFEQNRARMLEETSRFVEAVVFTEGGGLRELLTAPFSFADSSLARYYGWPDPGPEFTRVMRSDAIGVLGQGALLSGLANQDASSPTRRGLLVLERLLCRTRPTPPANVPPLGSAASTQTRTTRARYEEAHAQGGCAGCHVQFDPIGFAFEHFDQGGRYRKDEAGAAVDASGQLRAASGEALFAFDGQAELARGLAEQREVADCASGLLSAYAFGGGGGASCLAERARAGFASGEFGIAEFLAQLAAEPHFERRTDRSETAPPNSSAAIDAGSPGLQAADPGAAGAGSDMAVSDAGEPDAGSVQSAGDEDLSVQYLATNVAPHDNVIAPTLQLSNHGTERVPLPGLELRYYFTNEHAEQCPDGCKVESYYAGVHPSGQAVMAQRTYVSTGGAAAYLSVVFAAGAGDLAPGEAVELQQQFHTEPYRDFDETDDYSFDVAATALSNSDKVTLHRAGQLLWGRPPP